MKGDEPGWGIAGDCGAARSRVGLSGSVSSGIEEQAARPPQIVRKLCLGGREAELVSVAEWELESLWSRRGTKPQLRLLNSLHVALGRNKKCQAILCVFAGAAVMTVASLQEGSATSILSVALPKPHAPYAQI